MNGVRMFELRRLRLLHELALRGTIAEVAAALGFSPSAVSQQLSQLERDAGVALLEPDGRRLRLTEQGSRLAVHAARVLELDEAARAELRAATGERERVRIAVMPTAAQSLVPTALSLLEERGIPVLVEFRELPPEEALFELAARGFDLVVAEQYPGHTRARRDGVRHDLLGTDPIRVAVPIGDPVESLAELADRAWILEPTGTAVRQWAVQQCRAAGFEPTVRFEATDLTAHLRLVEGGHAVAMLPDLVWPNGRSTTVRLVDLPGSPVREIFAATRVATGSSAAVVAVRTALADALAAHRVR